MAPLPCKQCLLLLVLALDYFTRLVSASAWEHISIRYGTWYAAPKTPQEAERQGYRPVNKICKMEAYHGFLYMKGGNNKARFIYDLNGVLAGIQTAIPGNMKGFNYRNESIDVPSRAIIPPILQSDDRDQRGVPMYTITAYFKHPRLICSPFAVNAHPGKGLYIQTSYEVEKDFIRIPIDARHLDKEWKKGSCRPQMGFHYFRSLSPELPCEMLYPVFLMYNQEGQLGAFGWLFQGSPESYSPYDDDELSWFKLSADIYPFTFEDHMLPACMFNPEFRVFGLRVYLRNKDSMICPVNTPLPNTKAPELGGSEGGGGGGGRGRAEGDTPESPGGGGFYPGQRPFHPQPPPHTRLPTFPGGYTTLRPQFYDDNVIKDQETRERESGAASHRLGGFSAVFALAAEGAPLVVALTLLGLHALLVHCLVGWPAVEHFRR